METRVNKIKFKKIKTKQQITYFTNFPCLSTWQINLLNVGGRFFISKNKENQKTVLFRKNVKHLENSMDFMVNMQQAKTLPSGNIYIGLQTKNFGGGKKVINGLKKEREKKKKKKKGCKETTNQNAILQGAMESSDIYFLLSCFRSEGHIFWRWNKKKKKKKKNCSNAKLSIT